MSEVLKSALSRLDSVRAKEILTWLDGQPPHRFDVDVRASLIGIMASSDPAGALALLDKDAAAGGNPTVLKDCASAILFRNGELRGLDELFAQASPEVRPYLIEAAMSFNREAMMLDPQKWVALLPEIPDERRAFAADRLAQAWAAADPRGATEWAAGLAVPAERDAAVSSAVNQWVQSDMRAAANWIDSQPSGPTRDAAAGTFVSMAARKEPETAWSWALTIQTPAQRQTALTGACWALKKLDPALAWERVHSAGLNDAEIEALEPIFSTP